MAATDQLRIIDNKIKAKQDQHDLDRLTAEISAYSSDYLTGEDLRYKFEPAKFDYSPLDNIFTKGLDKDDQKEGLFRRLENIKDKNEELLIAFSAANTVNKADYNYDNIFAFYRFYRGFEKCKRMSLGSKWDEINDFYIFLNVFISTHEATPSETKNRINRILNNVNQLYNDYFNLSKKITTVQM